MHFFGTSATTKNKIKTSHKNTPKRKKKINLEGIHEQSNNTPKKGKRKPKKEYYIKPYNTNKKPRKKSSESEKQPHQATKAHTNPKNKQGKTAVG